jgi:hypothetical protein
MSDQYADPNAPTQAVDENDFADGESIKDLRDAAKRGRKATEENDHLKREVALLRSGVDTSTKLGTFFAENYKGELEPDAIRAAAAELGLDPSSGDTPTTSTDGDTVAAQAQAQRAVSSEAVDAAEPVDADPRDAGFKAYQDELGRGRSRDDAAAAYFGTVLTAAANGDGRVIIDPRTQVPQQ